MGLDDHKGLWRFREKSWEIGAVLRDKCGLLIWVGFGGISGVP